MPSPPPLPSSSPDAALATSGLCPYPRRAPIRSNRGVRPWRPAASRRRDRPALRRRHHRGSIGRHTAHLRRAPHRRRRGSTIAAHTCPPALPPRSTSSRLAAIPPRTLTNNAQLVLMAAPAPAAISPPPPTSSSTKSPLSAPSIPSRHTWRATSTSEPHPRTSSTLANDFMQINEYIDTNGGQSRTSAARRLHRSRRQSQPLADSISACINSGGAVVSGASDGSPCGNLFFDAAPSGGPYPTNTADAVLDIANNPFQRRQHLLPRHRIRSFPASSPRSPPDWTSRFSPMSPLPPSAIWSASAPSPTAPSPLARLRPPADSPSTSPAITRPPSPLHRPSSFLAGATSASFTYQGVASGTADITASATGYYGNTVTLTATSSLISLGTIPTVAPGQSTSLPLSLGTASLPAALPSAYLQQRQRIRHLERLHRRRSADSRVEPPGHRQSRRHRLDHRHCPGFCSRRA